MVTCPWCGRKSTVAQWEVVAELIYRTPDGENDTHWADCPKKCGKKSFWGSKLEDGEEITRVEDGMSIM